MLWQCVNPNFKKMFWGFTLREYLLLCIYTGFDRSDYRPKLNKEPNVEDTKFALKFKS